MVDLRLRGALPKDRLTLLMRLHAVVDRLVSKIHARLTW